MKKKRVMGQSWDKEERDKVGMVEFVFKKICARFFAK